MKQKLKTQDGAVKEKGQITVSEPYVLQSRKKKRIEITQNSQNKEERSLHVNAKSGGI